MGLCPAVFKKICPATLYHNSEIMKRVFIKAEDPNDNIFLLVKHSFIFDANAAQDFTGILCDSVLRAKRKPSYNTLL